MEGMEMDGFVSFFWFEFWHDEKNLLYEYGKLSK